MVQNSQIRKNARESLAGKWSKGVKIVLAFLLIEFLIGLVAGIFENISFLNFIISIAEIVISIPLAFGLTFAFIKLKRGEEVGAFDFIKIGFSNFKRSWKIELSAVVKMIVPLLIVILILVVGTSLLTFYSIDSAMNTSDSSLTMLGIIAILFIVAIIASYVWLIIKAISLSLVTYIAYDEPELPSNQVAEKSMSLMKGHAGQYFLLGLSFIGWALLATLTLGIGFLWLAPYMAVSQICFYDAIVANKE